jgi:hypothetical protein
MLYHKSTHQSGLGLAHLKLHHALDLNTSSESEIDPSSLLHEFPPFKSTTALLPRLSPDQTEHPAA